MHWELSDEQEMFASSLGEWIEARFPTDTVRRLQADRGDKDFADALVGEGWWGVGYPEESGGQGGTLLELALAAREFGRSAAPDSLWLAASLAAPVLTGDELVAQLSGDTRFALAVAADRIPGSIAGPECDGRAVSGTVRHVLAAADADILLVPVQSPDGPALARVAAGAAEITPENLLDRSRSAATVTFASAPVSGLAPAPEWSAAVAPRAATLVAADALGSAERMLNLSVDYSLQRRQFGQPIGAFQAVKHAAAQMLVTIEASYSIALYAAAALDAGLASAATVAAVAKAQVTGPVAKLADSALTVHGAIGYTWEHDLQLFYKRAKLDRVLAGTPSAWNRRVADAVLGPLA